MTTIEQDIYEAILADVLREYVIQVPFSNLAVLMAFLDHVEALGMDSQTAIETWEPDSVTIAEKYHGTNCVGATQIVKARLAEMGIWADEIVALNNGIVIESINYTHAALAVWNPETDVTYILDPGLGLVMPVRANEDLVAIADKKYKARIQSDGGVLEVVKPDESRIVFEFVYPEREGQLEESIQQPLLRATTAFKIDAFDINGYKIASLKIDYFRGVITFLFKGQPYGYRFEQVKEMLEEPRYKELKLLLGPEDYLDSVILRAIEGQQDVVEMWLEKVQRQYYLHNPALLSPYETEWEELEQRGYRGGGVVVVLVSKDNRVMMYEVPQGKEKPYIGRYAGQHNFFVETADPLGEDKSVRNLEGLETNLERAFSEEIGLPVPDFFEYYEVDYTPGIRARCVIVKDVDPEDITLVNSFQRHREEVLGSRELGAPRWFTLEEVLSHWIEPNAKSIFTKLVEARVLGPLILPKENNESN